MNKTRLTAPLALLLACSLLAPVWAQETGTASEKGVAEKQNEKKKKASKAKADLYLRLHRDEDKKPVSLDTAVVRYLSDKQPAVTVDLVGAVHIGEKEYYEQLNKRFQEYDALLYELVAPEGAVPQKGQQGGGAISGLQKMMTKTLNLQFQLEGIDYTKKNFVHADMSPKEFSATMKKRGESLSQLFFRMMGQSFAMQGKDASGSNNTRLLFALMSKDHSQMKLVMAEQFQEMEGTMKVLSGKSGSTIINERNKKALSVLAREIEGGKKRLGVFYGAGHLPDMDEKLRDMGFRPVGRQWLVAWRLTEAPAKKKAERETTSDD